MTLTGEQAQELRDTLCAAFTLDSLKELVRFKLGERLPVIVDVRKGLADVAFDLIEWTEQYGRTEVLIQEMYRARPHNARVLAWCQKHAPFVFEPERSSAVLAGLVGDDLSALARTARQPEGDRIRRELRGFREDLEGIRAHIHLLERYKALHDQLHTLDFQLYGVLSRAATTFRQNQDVHLELHDYTGQLGDIAESARKTAQELPESKGEDRWIDELDQVVESLEQALRGDSGQPERTAMLLLKGLLAREPSRINAQLVTLARELHTPLQRLTQAIRDAGAAAPGGLSHLEQLQPRLLGLIAEHDSWQDIDNKLRRATESAGQAVEEMLLLWPIIEKVVRKLCDLRPEEPWARELQAASARFTAAGQANDVLQQRKALSDFRRVARRRFFEVDSELRSLSASLIQMGEPLRNLVEVIDHGTE
jgi:chromosome segregation ATPase